jgi:uncharacterized protein (TIGR03435 family)
MMRTLLICLALTMLIYFSEAITAQSAPPSNVAISASPTALPTAYDIISIRPHEEDNSRTGSYWRQTPAGFSANVPVRSLIMTAYHLIMLDQIVGLATWGESDTFDIEAKLDPENADAVAKLHGDDRIKENADLMKALLADRFKMKAHTEVKDLPVYTLVIAKNGSKLKVAPANQPTGFGMGMGTINSKGMPIASLAASLSHPAGRLILDKTGLTSNYEVNLTWAWNDDPTSTSPSLFSALQYQLGLKLEPAKAPVDVVVIDHLERPSEN